MGRTTTKEPKVDPLCTNGSWRLVFELDLVNLGQWNADKHPETKAAMPRSDANVRYGNSFSSTATFLAGIMGASTVSASVVDGHFGKHLSKDRKPEPHNQ